MQKITPFLWFNGNAEEAMNFYVSTFKNSKALGVTRFGDAGPGPKGEVMVASFVLDGQEFTALNGGPGYPFTQAVSFVARCQTQAEVDELWDKLSEGGKVLACGWVADKFGLHWQVTPDVLPRLLSHKDPAVANRVMVAMMKMRKIVIADLEAAARGD